MNKTVKILLIILLGLFLLYTLVGFVVIPWALTTKLPPMLSEQLGRPVAIQDANGCTILDSTTTGPTLFWSGFPALICGV